MDERERYKITADVTIPASVEPARLTHITVLPEQDEVQFYFYTESTHEAVVENKKVDQAQMDAILAACGVTAYTSGKIGNVKIEKEKTEPIEGIMNTPKK